MQYRIVDNGYVYKNESFHKPEHIVGLDIYRILAVLFIFLFHSQIHLKCYYGIFNDFIKMGAIYMTAFFVLSGFVVYISWKECDLNSINNITSFYIKKSIRILPIYYFISIIYIVFLGEESVLDNILIAPIELLCLQSTFYGLFNVSHNNGTWFVSCIMICYLIYPFFQNIIKQITLRIKILLLFLLILILLYAPLIVLYFDAAEIYSDSFFRMLEFFIGSILASIIFDERVNSITRKITNIRFFLLEYLVLIIGVSIVVKTNFCVGNYMLYSWIALPIFILQLITLSGMTIDNNKLLRYGCNISYCFFFAQFLTWDTTKIIINYLKIDSNYLIIFISTSICLVYAILLHNLVEKPLVTYITRYFKGRNTII